MCRETQVKNVVARIISGEYRPISYVVRHTNGRRVGVVELWVADERSIPLLRHNAESTDAFETVIETHTAHHRIPLVKEFIRDADSKSRTITVKLPAGFLNIGREELLIRVLKRELEPYIEKLPNKFREKVRGQRELPVYSDLRKQGRADLVSLIHRAGGAAKVAATLGCKATQRPQGFFQDLDNLDWELSCFIASAWVQLPTNLDPIFTGEDSQSQSAADVSHADVPNERGSADTGVVSIEDLPNYTDISSDDGPRKGTIDPQDVTEEDVSGKDGSAASAANDEAGSQSPKSADNNSTTAYFKPNALISIDFGDELLDDANTELLELDERTSRSGEEYSSMTSFTHAGTIHFDMTSSNIPIQAGYDASFDEYGSKLVQEDDDSDPSELIGTATNTLIDSRAEFPGEDDEEFGIKNGDEVEYPEGFDYNEEADFDSDEDYYDDDGLEADDEYDEEGDDVFDESEEEYQDHFRPAKSVGEWYFFNTTTHQVSVEEPQVPFVHRVGQALVRVEDEDQRYMPSQASLEEAGRYDLLNAIRFHGGFQRVADTLQRDRLFTRRPAVTDREVIERKVRRVQQTLGLAHEEFPTREQLEACQMPEVVHWITKAGGFQKIAMELGMRTRRMMSQITPEDVANEMREFMEFHKPPSDEKELHSGDRHGHQWFYLPSLMHLREAGHEDLANKLKRSDSKEIAGLLGVESRKRGWPKGRLRKSVSKITSSGGKPFRAPKRLQKISAKVQAAPVRRMGIRHRPFVRPYF